MATEIALIPEVHKAVDFWHTQEQRALTDLLALNPKDFHDATTYALAVADKLADIRNLRRCQRELVEAFTPAKK